MSTNNLDIEESFFRETSFVSYNNIYHNLNNWHIKLEGWENKAGQIELYVVVPYAEMEIDIQEINNDLNFFNKNTARIKININKAKQNYLFNEKKKITINESIKYLIIDTPYIYPHNWYYIYNHEYLTNKINNSIDYINNFIQSYKNIFTNNIPFLFIDNIIETSDTYSFHIILKEYLHIFYITTNIENGLIFMNLLLDKRYQKDKNIRYKKILVVIPRLVKNKKNQFKFITGNFNGLNCDN
jgi:hypothetical protein